MQLPSQDFDGLDALVGRPSQYARSSAAAFGSLSDRLVTTFSIIPLVSTQPLIL